MQIINCYYDGCNGEKTGDSFTGTVDECAEMLVEWDSEDGKSLNDWTAEKAKEALLEAVLTKQKVTLDYLGDQQNWVIVIG